MLQVELFQGSQPLYQGSAQEVVLPGEDGELAVWAWHAPLLCTLAPGDVVVDERRYALPGGLACVWRNRVVILGRMSWPSSD